jgi:hypothetical protein
MLIWDVGCRCPGVTINSPYKLEEKIETNKWLQVVRGNSRQIMPLTLVSNHPFAEEVGSHHIPMLIKVTRDLRRAF